MLRDYFAPAATEEFPKGTTFKYSVLPDGHLTVWLMTGTCWTSAREELLKEDGRPTSVKLIRLVADLRGEHKYNLETQARLPRGLRDRLAT